MAHPRNSGTTVTLSTLPATVAARKRSNSKPNTTRRHAIRLAVADLPCMYCALSVDWSAHESDGSLPLSPRVRDPRTGQYRTRKAMPRQDGHAGVLAHVLSEDCGGTYKPGNIGPAHRACNVAAGDGDTVRYVITDSVPITWPSDRDASNVADVRERAPFAPEDAPSEDTMRAARKRNGCPF